MDTGTNRVSLAHARKGLCRLLSSKCRIKYKRKSCQLHLQSGSTLTRESALVRLRWTAFILYDIYRCQLPLVFAFCLYALLFCVAIYLVILSYRQ